MIPTLQVFNCPIFNMWGLDVDKGPVSFTLGRLASGGFGFSGGWYKDGLVYHLEVSTKKRKFAPERA